MKICSFLPTATTMIYSLGLQDSLVGVTHECDFPAAAKHKPVALRCRFDPGKYTSAEIDKLVSESLGRGESIYEADMDLITRVEPDLFITQEICEVCAFSYHEVEAVRKALGNRPQILSLNPHSLGEMLADLQRIADACEVPERGRAVVAELQARVDAVARRVAGAHRRRAICLEWLDPLFNAGHWVPELVELAGGEDGLGCKGRDSVRMEWDQVVNGAPEVLVLLPCGFDVARTEREAAALLKARPGWAGLPAVKNGEVWSVWGHKYFSGAGPHLVDGVELMAQVLHPELHAGAPDPRDARRLI